MKLTNIKLKLKGGAIMPLKYIKSVDAKNNEEIDFDELTPEQQMEVRKNLGLYYEETSISEKTIKYDNEPENPTGLYKISDDTPSKNDIVKVLNSTTQEVVDVQIIDIDGGYMLSQGGIMPIFHIIIEETQDKQKGIYSTDVGKLFTLVYNGETTTISKIDAKFLPEQEGGSSLQWLDVAALPSTNGDEVDISSNISQSDWNDLLDGKYIGIHVLPGQIGNIENYFTILNITKAPQGFVYPCIILGNFGIVGFDTDNQIKNIIYLIGTNVTSMFIKRISLISEIPEPIVLKRLPETSMTTQVELDAIGLTARNIEKLVKGTVSALCLDNGGGFIGTRLNLEYASYLAVNNFSLKFSTNAERYEVANGFGTITVTKTSLS